MGALSEDDFPEEQVVRQSNYCTIGTLLTELDADDAAKLRGWLDDWAVTRASISRRLRKHGFPVSDGVVARHSRGECRCGARGGRPNGAVL